MTDSLRPVVWVAALALGGLLPPGGARADEPKDSKADEVPTYNLLEAMDKGLVTVAAEGDGRGRMTLAVRNKSRDPLRVVLPPGLIASGASGQM
ncbi:MAG: hypothetical protein AB7I30_21135, partial [Isosphaeraceae bacterium]